MTEKIELSELKRISDLLFEHLETCGHREIALEKDYYWVVSETERYDPYAEPKKISLGQLYDDWHSLQRIASGESPPVGYALVWLSSLMTYIGETEMK